MTITRIKAAAFAAASILATPAMAQTVPHPSIVRADHHGVIVRESKFGVAETVARFKAALTQTNVPLFGMVDHAANATQAGESLRPTTLLLFGNPKVGTRLMQQDQEIGLDLPLRALVWEDARGRTWVGYPKLDALARRYEIRDPATIGAMASFMDKIVDSATNVH